MSEQHDILSVNSVRSWEMVKDLTYCNIKVEQEKYQGLERGRGAG